MTNANTAGGNTGHIYAVGIGSNRSLSGKLTPRALVETAFVALDKAPLQLLARSPIIATRPLGPSMRTYANAAALVRSALAPIPMLDHLQQIELSFGRRRYRRWGARTLDLDLLLWSGGRFRHKRLTIPHGALHQRAFALIPLKAVAPRWRAPSGQRSINQLVGRLAKAKPVDRDRHRL